jgi:uncharacterized protein
MGTAKNYVRRLFALEDTPERIALGFAVGVFISFSPLLGLHTVIGVLVAAAFGLNRVAVITGLWINNPWTMLPIYSVATYLGHKLMGFPGSALPQWHWHDILQLHFWVQLFQHDQVLKPLFVGSMILALFAAGLAYAATLYWFRRRTSRLGAASQ